VVLFDNYTFLLTFSDGMEVVLKNELTGSSMVLNRFAVGSTEQGCIDEVARELKCLLVIREYDIIALLHYKL